MAKHFAREGANVVVTGKTVDPHPKLKGTIHETVAAIKEEGGQAIAVAMDVRKESDVAQMVKTAVDHFGGIDVLVNNAGAIVLGNTQTTPVSKFDLMMQVNARAVFVCSQAVLPYLQKSKHNPHILNLCPPLNFKGAWMKQYGPYTLSKFGMTLLTLSMAQEFAEYGIAVNALWPKTLIATAAIEFNVGSSQILNACRKPEIMADAAAAILKQSSKECTGNCLLDEDFLRTKGVTDFSIYANNPAYTGEPMADLFL